MTMHVSEIWRYPVKSMIGETVPSTRLGEWGVEGDRGWATRDLERGGIRGAKKLGGLMKCAARYTGVPGGEAEITLPDGSTVLTSDPTVNDKVSAALGQPVRLEALRPADDLEHYRRGPADSDDMIAELRAVFGREGDEPLPDLTQFPPVIFEFESPPGTYLDVHPLMVMTTSALRSLGHAVPGSVVDVRRFRPSFVIDTGDEPGHPELQWPAGTQFQVGAATIEILGGCPRCVMTTREVSEAIPGDRAILRHIVRDLDQNLGAYARVVVDGPIHVGDSITAV